MDGLINGILHLTLEDGQIKCKKYNGYERAFHMKDVEAIIPKQEYVPKKGDKIYFIPGCTVPRFKVRQFCDTYKTAVVKYREKANVVVVGRDTLVECFSTLSGATYDKSTLLKYFNTKNFSSVIDEINATPCNTITMTYGLKNSLERLQGRIIGEISDKNITIYKGEEEEKLVRSIVNNPNVYGQNMILRHLNTGGVMDEEKYESVKRLFKSNDKENVKLGMETISNLDFEKSCVYLLLLIKEFGHEMYHSGNRHHVNFKALLKFFSIPSPESYGINNLIASLLKTRLLNQANYDLLSPIIKEQLRANNSLVFFKVGSLEPSEEILECLNDNVLDKNSDTEIVDTIDQLNPHL